MCGIAGAVAWGGSSVARLEQAVAGTVDAMAHRGPDGHGLAVCSVGGDPDPIVVLGHRRLAIIDLSERAAQPMASPRVRMQITYNGEIYNFAEVRAELEGLGRRFSSASDTEVVLQGYEQWGDRVVERLRGMFAAAIWDGERRELVLFRDRLGIKPLYLWRSGTDLAFASEVRALLASGLVPATLDPTALEQFLAYQTVPPPKTLVKGVEMLAPATIVRFDRHGRRSERQYWDLLDSSQSTGTVRREEAIETVRGLLQESVRLHLVSDVPVGVFLSGGIDSSAVASLVGQAGATPRTFAVGFPGTTFDEAPYARTAAAAAGAEHTEIALHPTDLLAALPAAMEGVDHPSGDGINTYVVAAAVRAAGVKVALSGLGGDEFFGGYPSFRRLRRLAVYAKAWRRSPRPIRAAAAATVRAVGSSSVAAVKAAAIVGSSGSLAETFPVMRQLFSRQQRGELLAGTRHPEAMRAEDPYVSLLERAFQGHADRPVMSLVSYAEARTYMHDVLLRDTDQMSMRHGLEVRVPLLDHRLAEYLMSLGDAVKDGAPKRLLLDALPVPLPPALVQRPKQGFVLPFEPWMKNELRDFCEHHLGPEGLGRRGILESGAVERLWESFLSGDGRTTWSRPWTLVALDAWMEAAGVTA